MTKAHHLFFHSYLALSGLKHTPLPSSPKITTTTTTTTATTMASALVDGSPQLQSQDVDSSVQIFRNSWSIYQKIISNNYMFHQEINHTVDQALWEVSSAATTTSTTWEGLRVLDLGSGDAAQFALVSVDKGSGGYDNDGNGRGEQRRIRGLG